jgi:hypothetical protein
MHQPHQTHSSAAFVTFRARHAPRLRQTASHARPATFSQTQANPAHASAPALSPSIIIQRQPRLPVLPVQQLAPNAMELVSLAWLPQQLTLNAQYVRVTEPTITIRL